MIVLLVQPSSAAVERVFSSLGTSFSHQQRRFLEDNVSLSDVAVKLLLRLSKNLGFLLRIMGKIWRNNRTEQWVKTKAYFCQSLYMNQCCFSFTF